MHFYGYDGPEDREWIQILDGINWNPTIAWSQEHDPNVWEIMD